MALGGYIMVTIIFNNQQKTWNVRQGKGYMSE